MLVSPGNGLCSSFTAVKLNSKQLSADIYIKENKRPSDCITKEGGRSFQIAYYICLSLLTVRRQSWISAMGAAAGLTPRLPGTSRKHLESSDRKTALQRMEEPENPTLLSQIIANRTKMTMFCTSHSTKLGSCFVLLE